MKRTVVILTFILSFCLLSCNQSKTYKDKLQVHHENLEPQEINIRNYNIALFSIDTANFLEGVKSIKDEYPIFLDGDLNEESVAYLKSFVTDTFCIRINNLSKEKFTEDNKIGKDIKHVYQRLKYYYPMMETPDTYCYVSGIDYEIPPVMIQSGAALISLDYYLGNENHIYDYIGMPRYRSLRCQPYYITRDLAEAIYDTYFANNQRQKDVLSEMINVGKRLYFVEALNPSIPDSVLLGYSSKQMLWANDFEGDLWASLVGDNTLYSNSVEAFRSLFGDGPFTHAFSNESPARLGEFVGLQIIRSYMTHNDMSLQDLIKNNDVQQIFQSSQYKPKVK